MPNSNEINYVGNLDTLYILTKLKAVLDGATGLGPGYVAKETGKGLSTEDFTTALLTKLTNIATGATATAWSQTQATGVKIAEITINGTTTNVYVPQVVIDDAMSDSSTNPVQNKIVKSYVDAAVAGVVGIKFDADTTGLGYTSLSDLQTKHPTGADGTIYLVQNSGTGANTKDEYFWNAASSGYEKFGSTDIDLSNYIQVTDMVEVSTSDIDAMFSSVFGS